MEDSANTFSLSAVSSSALMCETSRDISAKGMIGVQCACVLSCVHLFVILWTVAHQAPLSMEFSRQ